MGTDNVHMFDNLVYKTPAELSARKAMRDRKRKSTDWPKRTEGKTSILRLTTAFQLKKHTVGIKEFNLMKHLKT